MNVGVRLTVLDDFLLVRFEKWLLHEEALPKRHAWYIRAEVEDYLFILANVKDAHFSHRNL